jgi:hypothetical protein
MTRETARRAVRWASWLRGATWGVLGFTFGWVATEAILHGAWVAVALSMLAGGVLGELRFHHRWREIEERVKREERLWADLAAKSPPSQS